MARPAPGAFGRSHVVLRPARLPLKACRVGVTHVLLLGPRPSIDAASKLRKDGANLARAMTDMLDALDRKRGKGPQVVRVERVVVHEGGQAIVGNVQPGVASKVGEG